ncbi:MAG: GNAT family N-acetyltransferase [Thermodesulfobacteriota bacterium]
MAMMEARRYQAGEMLKNGMQVTVRAIRPDDRDALLQAFNALDEKTIYLRFFGPKRGLSPRELAEATEVDFIRTVALVTCLQDGQEEKIIGAGRYIAFGAAEPPDRAEVAFTVAEDYRGLGIAGMTLRHLAGIARWQGIARFQAEVLPENKGMLTVFNRSGLPLRQDYADGLVHVTLALDRGQP